MASWTQYLHWATDPIPAFTVPCVVGEDLRHDVAREVEGLVFDRVRLLNHLPQGVQGVQDTGLKAALEAWHPEQIEEHRA
jgi:hypothetical protein